MSILFRSVEPYVVYKILTYSMVSVTFSSTHVKFLILQKTNETEYRTQLFSVTVLVIEIFTT